MRCAVTAYRLWRLHTSASREEPYLSAGVPEEHGAAVNLVRAYLRDQARNRFRGVSVVDEKALGARRQRHGLVRCAARHAVAVAHERVVDLDARCRQRSDANAEDALEIAQDAADFLLDDGRRGVGADAEHAGAQT